MANSLEDPYFVGKKAMELRGLCKLTYPRVNGIVENWEDMEIIWGHLYNEELKILSEEVFHSPLLWIFYWLSGSIQFCLRNRRSALVKNGIKPHKYFSKASMYPPTSPPYKVFYLCIPQSYLFNFIDMRREEPLD